MTLERICMTPHPSMPGVFCAVPVPPDDIQHEGPHGWDYQEGEKALITRSEFDEQARQAGLGHLADRLYEIEQERP